MELKRIIARDTRAANEKAIQLYGEDVLIISTQRVDNQTELIVAVDIRTEPPAPRAAASVQASQAGLAPAASLASQIHAPAGAEAAASVPASRPVSSQALGQTPVPVAARVIEASATAETPFVSFSDWLHGAMVPAALAPAPAMPMPVHEPVHVPLTVADSAAATAATAPVSAPAAMPDASLSLPAALAFDASRRTDRTTACLGPDVSTTENSSTPETLTVRTSRTSRTKRQPAGAAVEVLPAADDTRVPKSPVTRPRAQRRAKPSGASAASRLDAGTQAHELRRSQEIVDLLRQEMAALRQEFALSRQLGALQDLRDCAPAIGQLAASLQDLGVPATLRTLLLDGVRQMDDAAQAIQVMQQTLERSMASEAADLALPLQGLNALCGPSGAGKSAMAARLACAAARQFGADQVAMISLADSRPGAWGQLQVLAAQAGVDCYRASDIQMLKVLLDDLQLRTAVFIDTAGTDFLQQAQALSRELPAVQCHAVLPVDATVTSVQKIFQTPSMQWSCLMLSKMDEAAHPWPLVKALCDHSLPVGAVASSERITQPAQAFDAAQLAATAMAGLKPQTEETIDSLVAAQKPRRSRKTTAARTASPPAESAHA